jgi:hypothetical protein
MPVAVELKGLLPGRGPGRGEWRWPGDGGAEGRGPAAVGRDAGGCVDTPGSPADGSPAYGSAAGAGLDSVGGTCGPTLWSCGNGTVIAGPGRWAAGASGDVSSGAAAGVLTSAGAAGAAAGAAARPLAAARRAAGAFAPSPLLALATWPANSSLSLRTTGASIVEDADRTNSPISWSLAITALLSTPNSFASS